MERVYIFDTTLRDGEQSPGISLGVREKLEIAKQLARLDVDVIEAGFPITSQGDFDAVSAIAAKVRTPAIAALARVVDKDIDRAWEAVRGAAKPRIHIFVSTSEVHMRHKLRKTPEEVLAMTEAGVKRAVGYTPDVEFSPEDATRSDFDYLVKVVDLAVKSGATTVNIPDTVGYATPAEFGNLIANLRAAVPALGREVILSVHCHNDLGLAVANSLAAVENGANQVECTINGLGERAGNAAMEEIVMVLDTRKRSLGKETGIKTEEIMHTSRLVSSLTNYRVQFNKAIVGANAFAHSSGIHTDGMLKDRTTYEVMDPARVGLTASQLVLGKTSGRHGFREHLAKLGHELEGEELERAFERFKDLADKKAEITDEDLEAIVHDEVRAGDEPYSLEHLETSSGTGRTPTALVRLRRNGEVTEATATGDGQVNAACKAIGELVGVDAKLLSFNVAAITGGLDAQGEVTIQLDVDGVKVMGHGVSTDIIEASVLAYLSAVNRALVTKERRKPSGPDADAGLEANGDADV